MPAIAKTVPTAKIFATTFIAPDYLMGVAYQRGLPSLAGVRQAVSRSLPLRTIPRNFPTKLAQGIVRRRGWGTGERASAKLAKGGVTVRAAQFGMEDAGMVGYPGLQASLNKNKTAVRRAGFQAQNQDACWWECGEKYPMSNIYILISMAYIVNSNPSLDSNFTRNARGLRWLAFSNPDTETALVAVPDRLRRQSLLPNFWW